MNNIDLKGVLKTISLESIRSAPHAYHIYIKDIGAISGSIFEGDDEVEYVLRFMDKAKCTEIFKVSISKVEEESVFVKLKKDVLNYMEIAFNEAVLKYFINIQVSIDKVDTESFYLNDDPFEIPFEMENKFEACKQFEYENYASYYSLTSSGKHAIVGLIDCNNDDSKDFGIKRYAVLKVPVDYYKSTFSNYSIYEQLKCNTNVEVLLDIKLNEFIYGIYSDTKDERKKFLEQLGEISFDIETSGEGVYRKFRDTFLLATKN